MTMAIDKTYRKEKLLDWELKSLTEKYSDFSFSKKSTWLTLGLIIVGVSIFALFIPFIPPRFGWGNWEPARTLYDYKLRVSNFLVIAPIMIITVFVYVNLRNRIDLQQGVKRTGNFKVIGVLDFWSIKILILNTWRPFTIKSKQRYFNSVNQGHIITIKRTITYKLIDYYIRNEMTFNDEQKSKKDCH